MIEASIKPKINLKLNKIPELNLKLTTKNVIKSNIKTPENKTNKSIKKLKLKYNLDKICHKKTESQIFEVSCLNKIFKKTEISHNMQRKISSDIKEKINNIEKFFDEKKSKKNEISNDNNINIIFNENQNLLKFNYKKKSTIVEDLTFMNNSKFKFQIEEKGVNYILNLKGTKFNFVDIDLFLQYISQEIYFYDNKEDNNNLIEGFCLQHEIFILSEILINKISSCFNYFYPKQIPFGLINFLHKYLILHNNYKTDKLSKITLSEIGNFLNNMKTTKEIISEKEELIQLCEIELKEYESSIKKFNPNLIKEDNVIKENSISSEEDSSDEEDENKDLFVDKFLEEAEIIKNCESYFDILKFKSIDIAAELTKIKYNLFCKIKVKEFLKGGFNSKDKLKKSPVICQIIKRFNNLSSWTMEEILSYDESKLRAKIIQKFIHICSALKKIGNFDDLFSILSALTNFNLSKLNRTWKKLKHKEMETFRTLSQILNFEDNWKNFRIELEKRKKEKKFYIPYLGYYTKRFLFLEEMGPYIKQGSSLMNIEKILEIYKVLKDFYEFKNIKYWGYSCPYENIKNELLILQNLEPSDENSLYQIANSLEPKFTLSKKKLKTKRPTKTDRIYFSKNNQNKFI